MCSKPQFQLWTIEGREAPSLRPSVTALVQSGLDSRDGRFLGAVADRSRLWRDLPRGRREWPGDWTGYRGRIDRDILHEVAWPPAQSPLIYVCGPTGFVQAASGALVELGHAPGRIRTERFGPTGT